MKNYSCLILVPLFLSACATPNEAGTGTRYTCDRGSDLAVTFDGEMATVRTADGVAHTLPQVPSASGARYSSGTHEFWSKGNEATWTIGRMVPTQCRAAS